MLQIEPGREATAPRDAATVVLLRSIGDAEGFEVFMVRRHAKSGFMGGAFVFPGGKLDAADSTESMRARLTGRSAEEAARALGEPEDPTRALGLFVAAFRETFEEAGVLLSARADQVALEAARRRLQEGASLAEEAEAIDLTLHLDLLVPWTRWVTPAVERRRYDTRFFLATAPPDQRAVHDERETTDAAWMTPTQALARDRAGEIQLPPPTMRSLEMLSRFTRPEEALKEAASRLPPLVRPVFVDEDGTWILALPGDAAHPEREAVIPGPTRFVMSDGRWWSGEPPEPA